MARGTLYRHFASKRELFLAAVDRVMVRLHSHVEAATSSAEDGLDRIRLGVRAYLEFFRLHPEFVELLVQERAQFNDRERPTYLEHRERNVQRWRSLYRQLMGEGRFRMADADRLSDVMSALLYGAMFLNDAGGRSGAFSIDAESLIEVFFLGVLSDAERAGAPDPNSPTRQG